MRSVNFPSHADDRGTLTAIEGGQDIPFDIQRIYFVHDVFAERGGHAHRETHQVVVAVSGRCELILSDGEREARFILDDVRKGVYIGPMLFIRTTNFSPGTVLVSMASSHYDKARSIRSWPEFLEAIKP